MLNKNIISNWWFLVPALAFNFVVIVVPSISSFYFGLTKWSGFGIPKFTGIDNYISLFNDRVLALAFYHNILWTIYFLIVPVIIGLIGAFLLSGIKRGQLLFRFIFFIPYVIASVVNVQLWMTIFHPKLGIFEWFAEKGINIIEKPILGNRDTSLIAVAFVDSWHFWGFLVVIYLAAMYQVDTQLYESARIEGANRLQQFLHVTLPGIKPTLIFTLLMIIIWSIPAFDYVYLMTQGGPAHSSEVMATHLYSMAFQQFEVGYASAIGTAMALFSTLIIAIFVILRKLGWEI